MYLGIGIEPPWPSRESQERWHCRDLVAWPLWELARGDKKVRERIQSASHADPLTLPSFSQPQSITQKGVHAHLATAREREHWFKTFVAFEPLLGAEFRASIARTPFCAVLWRSPNLSGTESVILNRESDDSGSCDSNRRF